MIFPIGAQVLYMPDEHSDASSLSWLYLDGVTWKNIFIWTTHLPKKKKKASSEYIFNERNYKYTSSKVKPLLIVVQKDINCLIDVTYIPTLGSGKNF